MKTIILNNNNNNNNKYNYSSQLPCSKLATY